MWAISVIVVKNLGFIVQRFITDFYSCDLIFNAKTEHTSATSFKDVRVTFDELVVLSSTFVQKYFVKK